MRPSPTIRRRAARGLAAALAAGAVALAGPAGAQDSLTEAEVRGFLEPLADRAQEAVADGDWRGIMQWYRTHIAPRATFAVSGSVIAGRGPVVNYQATFDRRDLARFMGMGMMRPAGMGRGPGRGGGRNRDGGGAGPMAAMGLSDYDASMEVLRVTILPNGEASASVVVEESGMVRMPRRGPGRRAGAGGQRRAADAGEVFDEDMALDDEDAMEADEATTPAAGEGPGERRRARGQRRRGPVVFHSTSRCDLRVAPGGENQDGELQITLAACDIVTTM